MLNKNIIFATLFWTLLTITTFLLLMEVKPMPQTWPKDKLEHAIIFGLLTFLSIKAYPKYVLYSCLALAIYGGLMELLQTIFTQTRTGSISDWLADLSGVTFGFFALNLYKKAATL